MGGAAGAEELPIAAVEQAVVVEIDQPPAAAVTPAVVDGFLLGDLAVAVGVAFLDGRFIGRQTLTLTGIGAGSPAGDVDRLPIDDGDGFHLPGRTSRPPKPFARGGRIGADAVGTWRDDLQRSVAGPIQRRCRINVDNFGALGFPANGAGLAVQGEQERHFVLVGHQNDHAVGEDGRGAVTVGGAEGAERNPPAFVAVGPVGDDSEVAEEDVDVRTVGDRAGRGRAVDGMKRLGAAARRFTPPKNLAGGAVEANRVEPPLCDAGDEIRSSLRTGEEWPAGNDLRQTRLREGPNRVGRPEVSATPVPFGPRNWLQVSAARSPARQSTVEAAATNRQGGGNLFDFISQERSQGNAVMSRTGWWRGAPDVARAFLRAVPAFVPVCLQRPSGVVGLRARVVERVGSLAALPRSFVPEDMSARMPTRHARLRAPRLAPTPPPLLLNREKSDPCGTIRGLLAGSNGSRNSFSQGSSAQARCAADAPAGVAVRDHSQLSHASERRPPLRACQGARSQNQPRHHLSDPQSSQARGFD